RHYGGMAWPTYRPGAAGERVAAFLPRPDEIPNVVRQLHPVLVAHVHHVPGVIIMELDAVLRDAAARQRIFGGEEGRRESVSALADEDPQARILAQCGPEIGRQIEVGVGAAPALDLPVPVAAEVADRLIFAVGNETQCAARPAVDGGRIAGVDAVEAGIVVGRLAGAVIVLAGVARVEPADGHAAVAQQL